MQPKRQPGRADRKAAAYAADIVRLRSAGYTYEAIREAMAEVGIALSTSALRREVRRLRGRSNGVVLPGLPSGPQPAAAKVASSAPPHSALPAPSPAAPPGSRSHEIAEAFFSAHLSNPLVRAKEIP